MICNRLQNSCDEIPGTKVNFLINHLLKVRFKKVFLYKKKFLPKLCLGLGLLYKLYIIKLFHMKSICSQWLYNLIRFLEVWRTLRNFFIIKFL